MTEATADARIEAEEEPGAEPVESSQKTGTSVSEHPGHSSAYSDGKNGGRHDTVADAGSSVEPLHLKETKRGTDSGEDTASRARKSLAALADYSSSDSDDDTNSAAPATDIFSSKVMSEDGRVGKQSETVGSSDSDNDTNSVAPATDILSSKVMSEDGRVGKQSETIDSFTSATSEDSLVRMETSSMLESSCKDAPACPDEHRIEDAKELKGTKEHIDESENVKEGDDLQETPREANTDMEEDTPVEKDGDSNSQSSSMTVEKEGDNDSKSSSVTVEKEGDNDSKSSSITAMAVDNDETKGEEEKNEMGPKVAIASVESIGSKMQTDASASDSGNVETANDLDEMMDMGTVDEVEQEAQMLVEEPDSRKSPGLIIMNTVSGLDNTSPDEEEKPIISAPTTDTTDQSEDDKATVKPGSPLSDEGTTTSGGDGKSLSGMKVVSKPADTKCEDESRDTAQQPLDSDKVKAPMSPLQVKVKDEPMDEEYDRALSSTSTAVKDEPDAAEELKISSVFSVGGTTAKPGSTATAPKVVSQSGGQSPALPDVYRVTCSHCKKTLMKGQTAYQRKGCPDLFCSTTCLSANTGPNKNLLAARCHCCFKVIERPQDVILSPVDEKGTTKEFCSDACLSTFNRMMINKNFVGGNLITPQATAVGQSAQCSVCKSYCICKHEVLHNGITNKICTDVCFIRFRVLNNLNLANCVNCGSFCLNNPITLKLEDGPKTLCKAECLATFKKRVKTLCACIMCNSFRPMSDMVDGDDSEGRPALFCNGNCVMAYKIKVVSTSGVQYPCDNCSKVTTPTYHLAMSDASIRNFCTLSCVMTYQDKFNKVKNVGNGGTRMVSAANPSTPIQPMKVYTNSAKANSAPSAKAAPSTLTQPTNVPSPQPNVIPTRFQAQKMPCAQCHKQITKKPTLLYFKENVVFLCSMSCSLEYQRIKCVASLCEYCKIPKAVREVKRINNKDCHFCSEGCKLLYNHDLAKQWGVHCRCCAYCMSTTKNVMTSSYGGRPEEFCSEECRSQYVMLFYQVAKCQYCTRQGKMIEHLNILGEVRYFCDLQCMLQHCLNVMQTQSGMRLTGPVPQSLSQTIGQALREARPTRTYARSCQTDPVKPPPVPGAKILKNKALLCRPMVQNKGITCKVNTVDAEAQTDDTYPKVLIVPVPVPVFLPVPMNLYSQYAPLPMGLPLPVPVPMFLPVAHANAERLVKTIKEIKDKIPSDPLEADLILMAEMVAEQEGGKEDKEKKKQPSSSSAYVPDDDAGNYSDDLDTDDLENLLNMWEEPNMGASNRTRGQERSTDVHMNPNEPEPSPPPPTPPPVLDVEADFTAETLEMIAQLREQQVQETPSTAPTRRGAPRRARNKAKARKSRRLTDEEEASQNAAPEPPKLESRYGVDAWKNWIERREKPSKPERPRGRSFNIEPKDDILRCTTVELAFGLCHFVSEVRRPNGERYSPDSLYYLCLCIQHHLFENGRVENIFTDMVYSKFAMEISKLLKDFTPTVTASGYIHSRVEEEYLWECKQLGAYSPTVLLNTLLFFCCKHFGFRTVEANRQLSFAHLMRCTRTDAKNTATSLLRFYPPLAAELVESPSTTAEDEEGPAAKKRKEEEGGGNEVTLEMAENRTNPLRCPVRLYEFYLSKCSESVKQRANMFYLLPERSCVPTSPLWFSTTPLDDTTMEAMLTRILTVREMLRLSSGEPEAAEVGPPQSPKDPEDPPFIPEDEEDSE